MPVDRRIIEQTAAKRGLARNDAAGYVEQSGDPASKCSTCIKVRT